MPKTLRLVEHAASAIQFLTEQLHCLAILILNLGRRWKIRRCRVPSPHITLEVI